MLGINAVARPNASRTQLDRNVTTVWQIRLLRRWFVRCFLGSLLTRSVSFARGQCNDVLAPLRSDWPPQCGLAAPIRRKSRCLSRIFHCEQGLHTWSIRAGYFGLKRAGIPESGLF